ncbi:efflux RND transporter periplasmic adaptor subunit [Pseudomonas atacamensis]|uniref:efflux RND transporter periplasmic adaptor subunit n=1 Tax=Pseudomonas atacamensis TaxID=2565368 RepID=UPI003C7AC9AC
MHTFPTKTVFAGVMLTTILSLTACDQWDYDMGQTAPREVNILTVKTQHYSLASEFPGRVEPMRIAEVRARVSGIVLTRNFEEGADVEAGQLLFQIDPAPLKAALSRAEGQLAQAQARVEQTKAIWSRYKELIDIKAVSAQDFDTAKAELHNAQAVMRSAAAEVETARLDLGYATVRAPIAGRIGRAEVTEGALVGQGEATLLARIQQLDPVYVDFKQPAVDALKLRASASTNGRATTLSAMVEGIEGITAGALQFADVAVDRGTGEITLRGKFDNPAGVLLPGMYVRVQVPQSSGMAIMVPQRAVQRSADGKGKVMLLGPNNVVEERAVVTGFMKGDQWQIREGLQAGDQLITSSLTSIEPGSTVVPRPQAANPTAALTSQAQ